MKQNFTIPDLKAFYGKPLDDQSQRWRATCAADKAAHIVAMLGRHKGAIDSILEVGCGAGAVIEQLIMHGVGGSITGCDFCIQSAARDSLKSRHPSQ